PSISQYQLAAMGVPPLGGPAALAVVFATEGGAVAAGRRPGKASRGLDALSQDRPCYSAYRVVRGRERKIRGKAPFCPVTRARAPPGSRLRTASGLHAQRHRVDDPVERGERRPLAERPEP